MQHGETRVAAITLSDDGIGTITIRPDVDQTVEDARENIRAIYRLANEQKCLAIVDIRKARALTPDVRRYYAGENVSQHFRALALVVESSPVGMMMGNIYFRIARLDVPMRLFHDLDAATVWLRTHG